MKAIQYVSGMLLIISIGYAVPVRDGRMTTENKTTVAQADIQYPGEQWVYAAPQEQGFEQAVIDSINVLMKITQSNGMLTRNGFCIGEWSYCGVPDKRFDTQSVTKSITSMVLGLAIRDRLVKSLDDPVQHYYPGFSCGPFADRITFRHLATNTSGIALTHWRHQRNPGWMEPGIENHYHNDHWTELARALTFIYGKSLQQVLEEKVLDVIQAGLEWWNDDKIGGYVTIAGGDSVLVNAGYAFSCWSARDLARVGYLYLHQGEWQGRQILPRDYVRESWTEIPQPIFSSQPGPGEARISESSGYGLGWWTRKGSNIWSMSGNGGQFCLVIPRYNIVMTKVNDYRNKIQLRSGAFLPLLLKAMGEEVPDMRRR